jgi:hypothetical protein
MKDFQASFNVVLTNAAALLALHTYEGYRSYQPGKRHPHFF